MVFSTVLLNVMGRLNINVCGLGLGKPLKADYFQKSFNVILCILLILIFSVFYHAALFIFLVGGEPNSNNLEGWQIALIIVVPLVAVVIMLSIGIYCACRRKNHNTELEMGAIPNMNNKEYTQAHHNQ